MSLETPAALWGLLSLALLVLFSLWRQAAVRTVVPSLGLWKLIPERNPPLRALRRPQWRLDLLLHAVAIAAAVTALARPYAATSRPEPRKIALVFDTSARMLAEDRLARAKEDAKALMDRFRDDEFLIYAGMPEPRRLKSVDEVEAVHVHVDPEPLLKAAQAETSNVVYFSDRDPKREGVHARLYGCEERNVGIVEFTATDQEAFVRIVNHGEPRRLPLELRYGDKVERMDLDLKSGEFSRTLPGKFGEANRIEVKIRSEDHFDLDDRAVAVRGGSSRTGVSLTGRPDPWIERALKAVPGVEPVREASGAAISVGVNKEPLGAPFRVWISDPVQSFSPTRIESVPGHRLTEYVGGGISSKRAEEMKALPGDVKLFVADGKTVGVYRDPEVRLSFEINENGWPSQPSFPIFWKNVVDFAIKDASTFVVARTGRPRVLPESGVFLKYKVGEFPASVPGGRPIVTNLLDPRESDTAGESRSLDWDPGTGAGRVPKRRSLAGFFAAAALFFVVAAWLVQRRAE